MKVLALGVRPYEAVLAMQQQLVGERQRDEGEDTLILCEHPPCYTLGVGAAVKDLRSARDVPVYRVGRGGGATWHGPGQLIGYPILRLRDWGWRVSDYLYALERALIATVRTFGVGAHCEGTTRGVYVADRKLASIGIQVSRGIVWHGFALNVSCDLDAFERIIPCRQPDTRMTSMARELHASITMETVQRELLRQVSAFFLPAAPGLGVRKDAVARPSVASAACVSRSLVPPVADGRDTMPARAPTHFAHPDPSAAGSAATGPADGAPPSRRKHSAVTADAKWL